MAFDLSKLKTNFGVAEVSSTPDGRMTTTAQPAPASAPAVLINRPASQRPVVAVFDGLTVTTIEGSAAAHALVEFVDTEGEESPKELLVRKSDAVQIVVTSAETTAATAEQPPKARRGRPRKTPAPTAGADTAAATQTPTEGSGGAGAPDPKAPAPAPTASGCAPSVGDLAVAVSALIDAVRALECHGKTGVFLEAAFAALRGES